MEASLELEEKGSTMLRCILGDLRRARFAFEHASGLDVPNVGFEEWQEMYRPICNAIEVIERHLPAVEERDGAYEDAGQVRRALLSLQSR